ncbi:hypothetical protein B7494_g7439 [Chlorociboria aeruginascens]|nr:hypothetical protein B7494_g7439 [Chlorociboria aeruginascens]
MPLQTSTALPASIAESLRASSSTTPVFLAVYGSLVDGKSWCGDTVAAEPLVIAKFGGSGALTATVVYAGLRDEWRAEDNPWRQEPFLVTHLPTLIKVTDGKWERLVEGDVYDQEKLDAFVGA